jgi:polyphenol oxidase
MIHCGFEFTIFSVRSYVKKSSAVSFSSRLTPRIPLNWKSMWLCAPNLKSRHGFSTRHGGFSSAPYHSLNFDPRADHPQTVQKNRTHALERLGLDPKKLCTLEQIHGVKVLEAKVAEQVGDGLFSNEPGQVLAIGTADCYPILLEDSNAGIVAAVHAGWRGTLGKIAALAVQKMLERGATLEHIQVAIGPGISGKNYEVSLELAQQFLESGFPNSVATGLGVQQQPRLDLLEANRFVLREVGILEKHVWASGRCSLEPDFFSYRRDGGKTGRMWAVIGL